MSRYGITLLIAVTATLAGCEGPAGLNGSNCTVADNGDGTATITCEDGSSVTVNNGADGADGADGINGVDGTNGVDGVDGIDGSDVDPATLNEIEQTLGELTTVQPEACVVCHNAGGDKHQAVYKDYVDSTFKATVDSVTSIPSGPNEYTTTVVFTILKNGLPYLDTDGLPSLDQKRAMAIEYDAETGTFPTAATTLSGFLALGDGQYQVSGKTAWNVQLGDGEVYIYVGDGKLDTEGMTLYADVSNAGLALGSLVTTPYESVANVSGCEKCHGAPYMKHGYRAAAVDGLPDFAACKSCHFDTKTGGHTDWQILVDDPVRYAELHLTGTKPDAAEKTKYAYTANVMNDVHMSHAMEFPYPQSMANCVTCHEGKLDKVLTDENFTLTTCKSCHAMKGSETYGTADRALETIWTNANVLPMHQTAVTNNTACNSCHKVGGIGGTFAQKHKGYDATVFAAEDVRYSDLFQVTVDDASFDSSTNILTVNFSATEDPASTSAFQPADIIPTLMVGLYGYDTKDFIVDAHGSTGGERNLEFQIDGSTVNSRFTTVTAANGSWEVNVDLSLWSDLLTAGTVRRAEIAVMPLLATIVGQIDSHANGETDDTPYSLPAPSRTFDLNAGAFDDGFYPPIVDVQGGCNTCHEELAITFHSPNRGGNIAVCRMCHTPLSAGSHLEMQSRSIDSYVHAIHSFQAFDPGDINFADDVELTRYELHIEHKYPNFTIKNCESCHFPGTYNAPDQSTSLPGTLSGSDTFARNIGTVPSVVTGPGARACGSCHRSHAINEDNANKLVGLYQHTQDNGYQVKSATGVLDSVIETIMAYFE